MRETSGATYRPMPGSAEEPGLFDPRRLARNSDPETSHEAARELVGSGRHGAALRAALEAVRAHPGMTSRELANNDPARVHSFGRRLSDLEKRGLVRKGEPQVCRFGGRRAVTWWPTGGSDGS